MFCEKPTTAHLNGFSINPNHQQCPQISYSQKQTTNVAGQMRQAIIEDGDCKAGNA